MKLSSRPAVTTRSKKRLGRGYGSGKGGHTSSRGQKGQRSRTSLPVWFEGGQLPQIRRFPFIKGKFRFKPLTLAPVEINLSQLAKLPAKTVVDPKTLVAAGLVKASELKSKSIKILGRGHIDKPLIIKVAISTTAQAKVEKAGGSVSRE